MAPIYIDNIFMIYKFMWSSLNVLHVLHVLQYAIAIANNIYCTCNNI